MNIIDQGRENTCPKCCGSHQVHKVSEIITSHNHTKALVDQLSYRPTKPTVPDRNSPIWLIVAGLALVCAMYLTVRTMIDAFVTLYIGFLSARGLPVLALAALAWFAYRSYEQEKEEYQQKQAQYKMDYAKWQLASQRLDKLYYCAGCDCVYVLGWKSWAHPDKMALYLVQPYP